MFVYKVIIVVLCFMFISDVSSYKILVIATGGTKSHFILGKGIADTLHDRGHNITFIHGQPVNDLRYREIALDIGKEIEDVLRIDDTPRNIFSSFLATYFAMENFMPITINRMLGHEAVMRFMADENEKFDLVTVDYLMNDVFTAFGVKYNCPVIMVSTVSMMHWIAKHSGNPISPATVASVYTDCAPEMKLFDRVKNTLMFVLSEIMEFTVCDKHQKPAYEKYFPEIAAKMSYSDVKRQISLVFSNTHPSVGSVRPTLPNVVEIGGFHIEEPKPLPSKLKTFLDNSKNVIYVSFGSVVNSTSMPEGMRKAILNSFSKFNVKVLWKFQGEFPEKPANIIVQKWMPQTSILAHPNTRLFVTHGGLLSMTEAVAAGVPLLSIPVFADQYYNSKIIESKKIGVFLEMHNITEESFYWALREILGNPIYRDNIKKQQELFNDRPMAPRDLIGYYAEYVIKNEGAEHLSAPHVTTLEAMLLDVIGVMLLTLILIFGAIFYLCKICIRFVKSVKNSEPKKRKKY